PSKTEGHGRAVVEAISNRVPVITSRAGGLKESVENSYSFDYRDLSSFTNLVEKLINNNEFRLNNIAENYNKVSNNVKEIVTKKRVDALKAYKNIINGEIRK
ncbi:glycosyltransferase, partial [Staphylococcus sp. 231237_7MaSpsaltlick]|uniref:glycosyltransferase n=1 Tax=Staphylococcus sp. 231237_7MaSpsaltlick TaxID=3367518 RepID=UPI00370B9A18